MTKLAALFSAQITGWNPTRNHSSGLDDQSATRSGCVIAMIFGACSPMITCKAVTSAYAIATEIATAAPWLRLPKRGSTSFAIAGSPRKPRPIEAIVIPT